MSALYWTLIALAILIIVFLLATKKGIKVGKKKDTPQTPSSGGNA